MDPYLEAPYIWPDVHASLVNGISTELNQTLPRPYYADNAHRFYAPIEGDLGRFKHHFVEVRDSKQRHRLVTQIEFLSPEIKQSGPDRDAYRAKRDEIFDSDVNLIELDLLRGGERVMPEVQYDPSTDYIVRINRACRRAGGRIFEVFTITLREPLPCIPVPLKEGEPDVPLDLQHVFNRVYDRGPYRRGAVDYEGPTDPPLSGADAAWAEQLLKGPDPAAPGS
jgi:hypothetical protein